jgi:hypothetical protein
MQPLSVRFVCGRTRRTATVSAIAAIALAVVILAPAPATADDVLPGSDLFETATGHTHVDFGPFPLPPGLFGPGSDPFTDLVPLEGVPLPDFPPGAAQGADTIVERLDPAILGICPDLDTIPIEIIGLRLTSIAPISVSFNAGASSSLYTIDSSLSQVVPQLPGVMTIRHECPEGGTFDSTLPVTPRLVFTKVAGALGIATLILDPAPALSLVGSGDWSHTDGGFGIFTSPGGSVDADGDGLIDDLFPPTSNFFAGVNHVPCGCGGGGTACRTLTLEEALLGAHGVLPVMPADHFKCYKTMEPFASRQVSLEDQFVATTATVLRPSRFCNPVDKNGEDPGAPTDPAHLNCYGIREPRFEKRDVVVENQFGEQALTVVRPFELCVPAIKDCIADCDDLLACPDLSHFKCYKVRQARGAPRFQEIGGVRLVDQFEDKLTTILKPRLLCTPVNKDGEDPAAPDNQDHLTCYKITDDPGQTRFQPRTVEEQDQFVMQDLLPTRRTDCRRSRLLCVPSIKRIASPNGAFLEVRGAALD